MEEFKLDELKEAVHKYTYDVLYRLKIMDCAPDMVQIGNEIRSGMLFPDGAVPQYRQLAALVNEGIRAVRELLPETKVMIHLDQGADITVLCLGLILCLMRACCRLTRLAFPFIRSGMVPSWI